MGSQAVDFTCPQYGSVQEVFDAIRKSPLRYDQAINEQGWIHLGFGKQLRHEQLVATFKNGLASYQVIK